jgi:hypothetical protein
MECSPHGLAVAMELKESKLRGIDDLAVTGQLGPITCTTNRLTMNRRWGSRYLR